MPDLYQKIADGQTVEIIGSFEFNHSLYWHGVDTPTAQATGQKAWVGYNCDGSGSTVPNFWNGLSIQNLGLTMDTNGYYGFNVILTGANGETASIVETLGHCLNDSTLTSLTTSGTFRFTLKNVKLYKLKHEANTDTDEGYPQYAAQAWVADPDSGFYLPFRNGEATFLTYRTLDYQRRIIVGAGSDTTYAATVTINGRSAILPDTAYPNPTDMEMMTELPILLSCTKERMDTWVPAVSGGGSLSARLEIGDWSGGYRFSEQTISTSYVNVTGSEGIITVEAVAPPAYSGSTNTRPTLVTADYYPDLAIDADIRALLPGGVDYPGSVDMRFSWRGWELVDASLNPDPAGLPRFLQEDAVSCYRGIYRNTIYAQRIRGGSILSFPNGFLTDSHTQEINQQDPIYAVIDAGKGAYDGGWLAAQGYPKEHWRLMLLDPKKYDLFDIEHQGKAIENFSAIGSWTATNGTLSTGSGTVILTASANGAYMELNTLSGGVEASDYDWENFRAIQFTASCSAARNITVTVIERVYDGSSFTDKAKTYTVSVGTSAASYQIDLMAPQGGDHAQSYDASQYTLDNTDTGAGLVQQLITSKPTIQKSGDSSQEYTPGRNLVGRVKIIRFGGIDNTQTLTMDILSLVRMRSDEDDTGLFCVIQAWQDSDMSDADRAWAKDNGTTHLGRWFHPEGKLCAFSLINYKPASNLPYAVWSSGDYKQTAFKTAQDAIDLLESKPGFVVTHKLADDPDDSMHRLSEYLSFDIAPARYTGGSFLYYVWKKDCTGLAYRVEGRFAVDMISPAFAVGNFETGDATAAFPARVAATLGTGIHGEAFHDTTPYAAAEDLEVRLTDGGAYTESCITNRFGYYFSSQEVPMRSNITVATDSASCIVTGERGLMRFAGIVAPAPVTTTSGSPVEVSGVNRRVYVGKAAKRVQAFYSPSMVSASQSGAHSVDYWNRFLALDRAGVHLLMVGKSGGSFKLYLSLDHGLTLTEVLSVTCKNMLIARRGEAREILLVYQDNTDGVYSRVSYDFGNSFATAVRCQYGGNMTAKIHDTSYEPRRKRYFLTAEESGAEKLFESADGTTFTLVTAL